MTDSSATAGTPPAPVMPFAVRLVEGLSRAAAVVAGSVLALMALQIVIDVGSRYLFNKPLAGTLEFVSNWWMPIIALLAFAGTEVAGEHINVTMLSERMHGLPRRIIDAVSPLVLAGVALWLAYLCADAALASTLKGETARGTTWLIVWPIKWVIVVGFVLLALAGLARVYRAWRYPEETNDD